MKFSIELSYVNKRFEGFETEEFKVEQFLVESINHFPKFQCVYILGLKMSTRIMVFSYFIDYHSSLNIILEFIRPPMASLDLKFAWPYMNLCKYPCNFCCRIERVKTSCSIGEKLKL